MPARTVSGESLRLDRLIGDARITPQAVLDDVNHDWRRTRIRDLVEHPGYVVATIRGGLKTAKIFKNATHSPGTRRIA